jgi:hypothetical protein
MRVCGYKEAVGQLGNANALTPALSRDAGEGDGSCEKRAAAAGLSPKPQGDPANVMSVVF